MVGQMVLLLMNTLELRHSTLAGWFGTDYTTRMKKRYAYFANVRVEGNGG